VRRVTLALLVGSVLAAGCGGGQGPGTTATGRTAPPTTRSSPVIVGEGSLVPIGGGRSLYLRCQGTGRPTVVLEAGFGGNATNWQVVQPQIARTTRTCSYDRAGLGNSVAMPGVHDAADEVADLGRLVRAAHLPAPYVVVGHSYGGLLVRLFARAHPRDVAGVVLVDAVGRDQTRRALELWPPNLAPAERRAATAPVTDGVDVRAGDALGARVTTLGDVPLAVITRGRLVEDDPGVPVRVQRAFGRLWARMQDELAALSPDHVHVVAVRSGHFVQGADGQPAVVVRATRAVVDAARTGASLPRCRELFSGPAVTCGR
jgi:pimeloyl-ACP methyl ester carboxylesterase